MKIKLIILSILSISFFACKNNSESKSEEQIIKTDTAVLFKATTNHIKDEPNERLESGCKCFNGIGSTERDKPILTSTFSNGASVSLCGFIDKEMHNEGLIMSEFNVFNCKNGNVLVGYGAVQICRIEEKQDALIIRELKYLPVGKNWNWELIQIGKQEITQNEGEIIVKNQIPELEKFAIDEVIQRQFLNSLKKGNGFGSEWESDLGKLEVLSLLGNNDAWEILKNYEDFTRDTTDGALSEQWKDAVATVKWIKEK
tara:strand:- start:356 stop:1126 length:771 start_codon:yes stop_codon:yes gene_type:complete